MLKDKITWAVTGIAIGLVVGFFILHKPPDIETKIELRSVDSKYWETQYQTLQKNYKSDLAKNIHTVIITHNTYDPAGHLTDQTISNDTLDLSTLTESYNMLNTSLLSLQAVIKERDKNIDKIINYTAGVGLAVNSFNLSELGPVAEVSLLGPIWLGDVFTVNLKSAELRNIIFAMYRF